MNCLNSWSERNCLKINKDKSKIIHFRRPSTFNFSCGDLNLDITSQYKYLELLVHEHLDYNFTAKAATQTRSRALGLLIAKTKTFGGLPFGNFSRLYDSSVFSVISYGASLGALGNILALTQYNIELSLGSCLIILFYYFLFFRFLLKNDTSIINRDQ